MHGSFRFYIDKWPDKIQTSSILDIFDMFSQKLGIPFSKYTYTLYDSKVDDPIIYVEYNNDEIARSEFLVRDLTPPFICKPGSFTAPIIQAADECDVLSIGAPIRVNIQLPSKLIPMVIRVDYDCNFLKKDADLLGMYKSFIKNLFIWGYSVNNSFLHLYLRQNTAFTLDCGQLGSWLSLEDKDNINKSLAHKTNGCVNCIMDVFMANSIRFDILQSETIRKITDVVGMEYTEIVSDNFMFALPIGNKISSYYRKRYFRLVFQLRKLLKSADLLARLK